MLTPLLRAENGQGGAFSYFYDEIDDVVAAAECLRKQPYVDANRLFVAGHSVGGTLTLLAAFTYPHFRAATSFSGAPFWPEFITSQSLPFDKSDPREIQMRSPIAYAGSFKSPLRMFYGTGEANFFRLMSQRTAALAKARGLDVETREVNGDHGSRGPDPLLRVVRGGFWGSGSVGSRSARRMPVDLTSRGSGLGFRVVVRLRESSATGKTNSLLFQDQLKPFQLLTSAELNGLPL